MNETDLRDCFAMLSMVGLVMAYKDNHPEDVLAERAYTIADAMLEARKENDEEELGIAAVKPKRKYLRRNSR
jgi:F0F1-type ATP synthase membrane subunit b/b'